MSTAAATFYKKIPTQNAVNLYHVYRKALRLQRMERQFRVSACE